MTAPTKHPARHALALIQAEPWAITQEALAQILEIAARENPSVEALEARLGEPLEHSYEATVRDRIATIRVTGPMFRYANIFTRFSGATSLQVVATDLTAALEDPRVSAILLAVDSPGGTVSGTSELVELLFRARGVKPLLAHIDGLGCSAAYWVASAADRITASDTSIVGSIGVIMAERLDEDEGLIEFVSSQSPRKRTSPTEELGRAERQAIVDSLAERFIAGVARNRGVSEEQVRDEFGQGGVFVGAGASEAGLIDGISTYEDVHAELAVQLQDGVFSMLGVPGFGAAALRGGAPVSPGRSAAQTKEPTMAGTKTDTAPLTAEQLAAQYPDQVASIRAAARAEGEAAGKEAGKAEGKAEGVTLGRAEGIAAENARILAIEALAMPGTEATITECKRDTACTQEMAAVKLVQAAQGKATTDATAAAGSRTQRLEALKGDEQGIKPPAPQPASDPAAEGDAAAVDRILAAARVASPPTPTRN